MRPWLRNALTFGAISAVATLALNAIGGATAGGTACHKNSPLGFVAFLLFLLLMGGAGFMTARAGDTVGMATVAGLLAAVISAVGTIIAVAIIFSSISPSCVQQNNTGVSTSTLLGAAGIVAGIVLSLIGVGVGAGAGAIGGVLGRRPSAATAAS
jgi:hypothetical protein